MLYAYILSCDEPMNLGVRGEQGKKGKNELGMGHIMSLIGVIGILIAAIISIIVKVMEKKNRVKNEAKEN